MHNRASLLVVQHVPHERLGTFEAPLREAGCSLIGVNTYDPKAPWPGLEEVDGLVVMGGPQSVYEQRTYPFLTKELQVLREAIDAKRPVLGVCLGAQLLASALGAPVTKNRQKEIGWYPIQREPSADGDPLFEIFGHTETVFQWHGDTFALPKGAVQLASSPLCAQQAFRYGDSAWGLQFHLEVTAAMIRAWLTTPANKAELATLRGSIDPLTIKQQTPRYIERLQELGRQVATVFCHVVLASNDLAEARR